MSQDRICTCGHLESDHFNNAVMGRACKFSPCHCHHFVQDPPTVVASYCMGGITKPTQYLKDKIFTTDFLATLANARIAVRVDRIEGFLTIHPVAALTVGLKDRRNEQWLVEWGSVTLGANDTLTLDSEMIQIDTKKIVRIE